MEGTQYIFGHDGNAMILKTVGATHTDLSGHLVVVAHTDVDETTHTCDILRKYRSFEGADGTCYDVYLIGGYYCDTDASGPVAVVAKNANEAASIAFVTLAESGSIDDVTASEHMDVFAPWVYPADYKTGNLRRHNGRLYKCIGDHISQADWAPDVAVSLWVPTSDPAEEYPAWSQPVGAHDAYNTGDKVSHNAKHWTSDVDGNVWEPGVYGWTEVTA